MQTPSQTFIAVKFDTTGNVLLKPLDVVKKFNIVVTPVIHMETDRIQDETEKEGERYISKMVVFI